MSEQYYHRRRVSTLDNVTNNNHERWLVSYADFMTLLMAFFVVMYSISQVSEEKYRVLSATFTQAFSSPKNLDTMIDDGEPQLSYTKTPVDFNGNALEDRPGNDANVVPENFTRIADELAQSFERLSENEAANVTGDERWLEIELPSGVLFGSGGAVLNDSAKLIIADIAQSLKPHKNVIQVEGFTDDIPITTPQFASNWELSGARATAVVKQLIDSGISPSRLAAVGYGEHQPVANNNTEEGRARNRRIVLMVSTKDSLRPYVAAAHTIVDTDTDTDTDTVGSGNNNSLTRYQAREVLSENDLVHGLTASARSQAEAWLAANLAALEQQSQQLSAGTIDNEEAVLRESFAVQGQNDGQSVVLPAVGIKSVQTGNGALLFTQEE